MGHESCEAAIGSKDSNLICLNKRIKMLSDPSKVSFIQLNERKSFAAATELNNMVTKCDKYVSLLTEPYSFKKFIAARPPGSRVISSNDEPRAAIIHHRELNIIKLEQFTKRDCAVGIMRTENEEVLIVSAYMDIKMEMIPSWLIEVVNFAETKHYPIIVGLDTNAHSTLSVSYTHLTLPTIYSV